MKLNVANTKPRVHGTKEWAKTNINIQSGCEHDCRYCYAKAMAIRFGRATAERWQHPVQNLDCQNRGFKRRSGRIMFPSSHDITPLNIDACSVVLSRLLKAGNDVLIVSKPRLACVQRLCKELEPFKSQVLFRFTICSADDAVLGYWEPGAPAFAERLESLKHAHSQGYATSVSMEPMLDSEPAALIEAVSPYVTDSVWLGKANRLRQIVSLNCPDDPEAMKRASDLVRAQDHASVIKIYNQYKDNPLVRWKDSIKKVVGIQGPAEKGLDV